MTKPKKPIYTILIAITAWIGTLSTSAEELFPLFVEGEPMAEIVIDDHSANPDFSPWLLGAELHIPGNSAVGIGRPWVDGEIPPPKLHPWSRAGVGNTVEDVNLIIEQLTGAKLPVVSERTGEKPAIVFEIVPASVMEDDAFEISFPDSETLLIKGSGRSVRWAFNYLLEEHAGVRWLFYDGFHYPETTDWVVPMETVAQTASFPLQRYPGYYRPQMAEIHTGLNTKTRPFPRSGLHAMTRDVFPVEKYAFDQSWPEEILPIHGGSRITLPAVDPDMESPYQMVEFRANWHPCFSNPATAEIAIENILEILEADPDRQFIGIGVLDRGGHCRCDDCLAVVDGRTNGMGHPHYSDLYFAWANQVAEAVTEKYPKVYFDLFAYREVFDPPNFKLHPHLVPYLTIDIHQTMDEEVGAEKWRQIANWAEVASKMGVYEYGWGISAYALPRIYYQLHSDFLKRFHEYGGVASEYGNWSREGHEGEGPKGYLYHKLLWDIDADPDEIIDDWIVNAVGSESAPYLREYFAFWEDYWTGDDIRRTVWFQNSVDNQYFRWREWTRNRPISHTFALRQGDMAHLRDLMQKVVDHAGTKAERERAEQLMLVFEYYEANADALLSELLTPEGAIESPETAVQFIESVPAAFAASQRRDELIENIFERPSPYIMEFDPLLSMLKSLEGVGVHANSEEVRKAIEQLLANTDLTAEQREAVSTAWERGVALAELQAQEEEVRLTSASFGRSSTSDLELDGQLDDPFWEGVPVYQLVDSITGAEPAVRTEFQVAWAEDGLYFAIRAEEPAKDGPIARTTEDQDNNIFQDDNIEILIATPTHSYYQIVVNAAGAIIDLDRSDGVNYDWTAEAQAAAYHGDGYWSLEVRIPVDAVEEFDPDPTRGVIGARPSKGEPWYFNICRMHRSGDDATMAFIPLGQPGFHYPELFSALVPKSDADK